MNLRDPSISTAGFVASVLSAHRLPFYSAASNLDAPRRVNLHMVEADKVAAEQKWELDRRERLFMKTLGRIVREASDAC